MTSTKLKKPAKSKSIATTIKTNIHADPIKFDVKPEKPNIPLSPSYTTPTITEPSASASASASSPSSPVLQLARSHVQQPVGRKLLINTEFVFNSDHIPNPVKKVCLRGDWNAWKDISMNREQGTEWSIRTPVVTGYHEFYFVCDGICGISPRHPTARNDSVNCRNVLGPANSNEMIDEVRKKKLKALLQQSYWLRFLINRLGFIIIDDNENGTDNDDSGQNGFQVLFKYSSRVSGSELVLPNTMPKPKQKATHSWIGDLGVIGFIVVTISTYLIFSSVYALLFTR